MKRLKTALIDEWRIFSESLAVLLEDVLEVVVREQSAVDGLRALSAKPPELLILENGVGEQPGTWLIRKVRKKYPVLPILVLSFVVEREQVLAALSAGANGYLSKSVDEATLRSAVESVMRGQAFLQPSITSVVVEAITELQARTDLTAREIEILSLASSGLNNQEIAMNLELSVSTVKGHMRSVFRKLQAESRMQAVLKGIDLGLLDKHDPVCESPHLG